MDGKKDKIKGPTIIFLSIFMIYLIAKVIDYLFFSTYKLNVNENILAVILSVIMIIPTVVFMILLIKNNIKAKTWLHISAGTYVLSSIISLIQVMILPSGNKVVTRIGPMPVQIFGILIAVFYWLMLKVYFKTYADKYR